MPNAELGLTLKCGKCEVSGVSISSSKEWQDVLLPVEFSTETPTKVSFFLIGTSVFKIKINGCINEKNHDFFLLERERFLKHVGLWNRRYVELRDDFNCRYTIERVTFRKLFLSFLKTESARHHMLGFYCFHSPAELTELVQIESYFSSVHFPVKVLETYEQAMVSITTVLKSEGLLVSVLRETGFEFPTYGAKFKQVAEDTLFAEVWGTPTNEYIDTFFSVYEQFLKECGFYDLGYYYRITDWSRLTSDQAATRQKVSQKLHDLQKVIPCRLFVIYGASWLQNVITRLCIPVIGFSMAISKDYSHALQLIQSNKLQYKYSYLSELSLFLKTLFSKIVGAFSSRKKIEKEISRLIEFTRNENWREQFSQLNQRNHFSAEILAIYEAIGVLRYDYEGVIAEKQEMQEKLFQQARLASVGQLAAGVGHEVNNPLAIIRGFTALMQEKLDSDFRPFVKREDVLSYVKRIDQAAARIHHVVKNLTVSTQKKDSVYRPIDMHEAVDEALLFLDVLYQKDKVKIIKDYQAKNPKVLGYSLQFQQVISNLMSNSFDAMAGVQQKIIEIQTIDNDHDFYLIFKDTGCGIHSDRLNRVFDAFYTTKEVGKGTGLGLYIVSSIVREMKGEVAIKSDFGTGTTFEFKFPKVANETATVSEFSDELPLS